MCMCSCHGTLLFFAMSCSREEGRWVLPKEIGLRYRVRANFIAFLCCQNLCVDCFPNSMKNRETY